MQVLTQKTKDLLLKGFVTGTILLGVFVITFVGQTEPASQATAQTTTTQAVHETTTYAINIETWRALTTQPTTTRISERWTIPVGGDPWQVWRIVLSEDGTSFELVRQYHQLDLNRDEVVNGDDVWIAICLFDQLGAATHIAGDMDQDGDVDLADYTLFVQAMTGPRNGICGDVMRCVQGMQD